MPLTLRNLIFWLLCIVTFMVPFEELLALKELQSGIFLVSAVALALSIVKKIGGSRRRQIPLVLILLALFILWCCASFIWTVDSEKTLSIVITYSSLLLFIWMIWEFTNTQRQLLGLLRSYLTGCCVTLAMLFTSYATGIKFGASDTTRYTAAGMNQNGLALIFDIGVLFAVYLAGNTVSKWRIVYWAFVPLASLGILLTGSRAGAIGLAVALGMTGLLAWSRGRKSIIMAIIIAGCTAWLAPRIVSDALLERVMEGRKAHSFMERQALWHEGLQCWDAAPITGVGAGGFMTAVRAKTGRPQVAHNTFVQILVDNGLVGIGLMSAVWGLLIHMAWRLPRRERFLYLGLFAVWVIASMSGSTEYSKYTWLIYAWIVVESEIFRESLKLAQRQRIIPKGRPLHEFRHYRRFHI